MGSLPSLILIFIITKKYIDTWTLCNKEEAETNMLFHTRYSVASNNVVVRTVYTDKLIIVFINMENLAANINAWL